MIKNLLKLASIGIISLFPNMAYSQATRITDSEDFSTPITRPYSVTEFGKWNINTVDGNLECEDINKRSGWMNFYFDDKNYLPSDDFLVKTSFNKDKWGSDIDMVGLTIKDNNDNFCYFGINASQWGTQWWVLWKTSVKPGNLFGNGYNDGTILPNQSNILEARINQQGTSFLINGQMPKWTWYRTKHYYDEEGYVIKTDRWEEIVELGIIPYMPSGKIGLFGYDSMGANDPDFISKIQFDYLNVEHNLQAGGGSAFIRGDADYNELINITDPIIILEYLFRDKQLDNKCLDALDTNDDGQIDISDAVFSLLYQFGQNIEMPLPFPNKDIDPTLDNLTCQ